jgi:endogenous inhibitor of DNA gyrase (YacG/DUF329 family)
MRQLPCPTCKRPVQWHSAQASPSRPFCSDRCRLIDLGEWLTEKHAIPGDPVPDEAGDADQNR